MNANTREFQTEALNIVETSVNIEETSIKIEVEEHVNENKTDLVINNETSAKIEDNPTPETVNQESNGVLPKVEKNSSPETSQVPKESKSETEIKNGKMDTLKRTRSAPALRTKRTRKNIHDFIK